MTLAAPKEITFDVYEEDDGRGYYAKAQGYGIFTLGDDWEALKSMAQDAVLCHFDEGAPETITLRLVKQEVIAV